MDSELFHEWFTKVFLVHANKRRPLLLIMDNHESHLNLRTLEKAKSEQVLSPKILIHK